MSSLHPRKHPGGLVGPGIEKTLILNIGREQGSKLINRLCEIRIKSVLSKPEREGKQYGDSAATD